ncbi:hypothetical protein [Subtercola lobariae]|uniref:Uncharacterized protein n=1 Tax=Subtercola lobariae TaxID=1588641 RepID=A0A917EWF5_9MICO|nr:hypothetical protein [Subtercola lobariae]GGF25012.1 hypothetical protein GCM10011399_18140 [Subtercola lobariae]
MSDANETETDRIEEAEDKREEAQFDKSVEEDGLLPAPEATPTDGPAPGA